MVLACFGIAHCCFLLLYIDTWSATALLVNRLRVVASSLLAAPSGNSEVYSQLGPMNKLVDCHMLQVVLGKKRVLAHSRGQGD